MTKHDITRSKRCRTALRVPGTFLDRPLERMLALAHEWRARRNMMHSLGRLSDLHLRDIGLTDFDVRAACADSFDRSASRALKGAAHNRIGNW